MHKRASSLRWAKEAEKEVSVGDKEVTSVEDAEQMLPPREPVKPMQPENQPEKPTQPGDADFMEMMRIMMEDNRKKMEETLNKKTDKTNKNIESLKAVSYTHLDVYKRQILTLPISNIVIVGATGRQNRTVRKQVQLELTSDGQTLTITFLVASGLPFQMLIGCDMLRQYSAIIDLSKSKLFLKTDDLQWTTDLNGSDEIQSNKTMYHMQKYRDAGEQRTLIK